MQRSANPIVSYKELLFRKKKCIFFFLDWTFKTHRKNGDEIVSACCKIGVSSFSFPPVTLDERQWPLDLEEFRAKQQRRRLKKKKST